MLPKWHILSGLIFALIFYLVFPAIGYTGFIVVFLSSFLIDADHYLYRIYKNKESNIFKIYNFCKNHREKWINLSAEERKKYKRPIHYFHGIEFLLIIAILSFFYPFFLFILSGILFHLLIDYIEIYFYREPFYSKFSQIYVYITNKNKKELF